MAAICVIDDEARQIARGQRSYATINDFLVHKEPWQSTVVFLHGSNLDLKRRAPEGPADLSLGEWFAQGVCRKAGRLVVFSGGTAELNMGRVRDLLSRDGCAEGHHFLGVASISDCQRVDLGVLPSGEIPKEWRIDKLFRGPQTNFDILPALAMLCQGYLAVAAANGHAGESEAVATALEKMGWNDLAGDVDFLARVREAAACCFDAAGTDAQNMEWWLAGLRGQADARSAIEKVWDESRSSREVVDRFIGCSAGDGTGAEVVGQAYLALYRQLHQGSR